MNRCLRCGYEIIAGGRTVNVIAQHLGYCCEGCRYADNEFRQWLEFKSQQWLNKSLAMLNEIKKKELAEAA